MHPQKLVDGIDKLVSLPDVCVKVNRLADSPNYSAVGVGEIIAQDTDLSARLLCLVNSAFFGMQAPVDTISRAVTVIGTNELRNLVMATVAARVFTGVPGDLVDMAEFWRYSVTTGVIARDLAGRCRVLHGERLFVMGILHDIGRLVIYLRLAEQARDILLITGGDDSLLAETERDLLGFDHMQVGAELLRKWKLPEGLVAVVGSHHHPLTAGDYRLEASLVHIATVMANGVMNGFSSDEIFNLIDPAVWEISGLTMEDLKSTLKDSPAKVAEVMDLVLSPGARSHSSS